MIHICHNDADEQYVNVIIIFISQITQRRQTRRQGALASETKQFVELKVKSDSKGVSLAVCRTGCRRPVGVSSLSLRSSRSLLSRPSRALRSDVFLATGAI